MAPQKINACEILSLHHAPIDIASALVSAARLPVLISYLVFESIVALVAIEINVVEGLNDKAIDLLSNVKVGSAAWTGVICLQPLSNAGCTLEFSARLALLGVFHDEHANSAAKILLQIIHCIFCGKLLEGVHAFAIINFSL